jgi:hypothetical protein
MMENFPFLFEEKLRNKTKLHIDKLFMITREKKTIKSYLT